MEITKIAAGCNIAVTDSDSDTASVSERALLLDAEGGVIRQSSISGVTSEQTWPNTASDSNATFISSMCALCIVLVSIYNLAARVLLKSALTAPASQCLIVASLVFQCIASAALAVCIFAVESTRLRINQLAMSWQISVYTRGAADCVLICTAASSNLLIADARNGIVPFELNAFALCSLTICFTMLRGVRRSTALIAWAISCAFVLAASLRLEVSTLIAAGAALMVILRITSLQHECALLQSQSSDQHDAGRKRIDESTFVSVSVMNQAVFAATQVSVREARTLAIQVASATQDANNQIKVHHDEVVAALLHSLASARMAYACAQQQAEEVAIVVAAAKNSAIIQARSKRAEAVRIAQADSALVAQALSVATLAATDRAKQDATALAIQVAIASASAMTVAQAKADSAMEAARAKSISETRLVEAASTAKAALAKQESVDLALVVKAASDSAAVLALAKADADAAIAKRVSSSLAETLAAETRTLKLIAQQESTALADEVAATSLTATAFALAKSDAAAVQASRACVAQAHVIAAETLALSALAKHEANSLARQVALESASAVVSAQAKSDSEAASARVKSESLVQELATANETNALLENALLRSEKQTLESNSSQLRALMGNVAHDLKTPLQAISMGLEMFRLEFASRLETFSHTHLSSGSGSLNETGDESAAHETSTTLLDNMTASCEFMRMAIHRSIVFTKSSSNIALVPALETVDLEGTVRNQLHMIRSVKPGVQINLDTLPVTMCAHVVTDKHWLAENVLCLLSNAVKYSDGGSIDIRFDVIDSRGSDAAHGESIESSICASVLRITISDTGIGVPESVRANLFQPFQQAQKMAGGTGLGLYSMRKRVDALAGDCGVASRDDGARGSAFWFEFPYRPDISAMKAVARSLRRSDSGRLSSPALSGSDSDGDRDSSGIDGNATCKRRPVAIAALCTDGSRVAADTGIRDQAGLVAIDVYLSPAQGLLELDCGWAVRRSHGSPQQLRILLIDDAPFIITMATRVLEKKGHIVQSAANGSLGLSVLMETHRTAADFDLVLCDFQMPVMDGFEAIRRYRAYEGDAKMVQSSEATERPPMAIVGMSANSDLASMALAREVGMNAVLTKPFSIANLQGMLSLFR